MRSYRFGILLFVLLFVAAVLLAGVCLLSYIGHASKNDGMQSVAAGFGILVVLIPLVVIVVLPACFVVIFFALRSKRR